MKPKADMSNAKRARDQALEQVENNAHERAKDVLWSAILKWAKSGYQFSGDNIWATIGEEGRDTIREPRLLGALMMTAAREGLIQKTGDYVLSSMASCHARPKTIWIGTVKAVKAKRKPKLKVVR